VPAGVFVGGHVLPLCAMAYRMCDASFRAAARL
jgi:hypothetical protein